MCSKDRCRMRLTAQGAEEGRVPGEEAGMELPKEGRVSGHHSGHLREVCQKRRPAGLGLARGSALAHSAC